MKRIYLLTIFALALMLSCSDLGRDNPNDPKSDKYVQPMSSSVDVSSSSSAAGESSSSSSEGESSNSSSSSSSSSSEGESSSSCSSAGEGSSSSFVSESSSNSSADESSSSCNDKCEDGKCYDKATQFCYEGSPEFLCGGNPYSLKSYICCGNARYPKSAYGCCGGTTVFQLSGYGCSNNVVLTKCGDSKLFNPANEFCTADYDVKFLCGGSKPYDPKSQECIDGAVNGLCGEESIDVEIQFCYDSKPYTLCGGKTYDPTKQFCTRATNNPQIVPLCGDKGYDTRAKFCYIDEIYDKCNGATYNPELQFCTRATSNPKIVEKCEGKGYDTRAKMCHNGKLKDYFTDSRDEKKYPYVEIGTQIWMAENLNYNVTDSKCYGNDDANCTTYGRLYNWATALAINTECNSTDCGTTVTAKHSGICPTGWYIPTETDWKTLTDYVDSSTAGTQLKTMSGWKAHTTYGNGTDYYGFSALPGGALTSSGFSNVGENGFWWSATQKTTVDEAIRLSMSYGYAVVSSGNAKKSLLFSVRCVKDN